MNQEIKNLSIEETIVESGLFYFDDGYLGSTGHGASYYEGNSVEEINKIKDENDLNSLILNEELYDGEDEMSWNEFFDEWFSNCNEVEIIEDSVNGGNGYGKFIVNKEERYIKIMVVPCLYSKYGSNKDSDIKIFSFDWKSKKLVREINEVVLNKVLEDKDYYIG